MQISASMSRLVGAIIEASDAGIGLGGADQSADQRRYLPRSLYAVQAGVDVLYDVRRHVLSRFAVPI